jgi:hypothetical protein
VEQSETIAELAKALSAAQAVMDFAHPDSENPGFKRDGKPLKYASLRSVIEACRPALTANGLSVVQTFEPTVEPTVVVLTTALLHSSGEWIRGSCSFPVQGAGPQSYASASTYARRYALMALLGMAPDDDDGNAASAPAQERAQRAPESRGDQRAVQAKPPAADHSSVGSGERGAIVAEIGDLFRELHPGEEFYPWAKATLKRETLDRLPVWDIDDLKRVKRHLTTEKAAREGQARQGGGEPPAMLQGA